MKTHSTLGLLMAASLAAAAHAADAPRGTAVLEIQTEAIRYEPAAVSDERGAKDLFMRIRRAAQEVCSISNFPRGYEIWNEHGCETAAVDKAVRDAGVPALDGYYADLTSRPASSR